MPKRKKGLSSGNKAGIKQFFVLKPKNVVNVEVNQSECASTSDQTLALPFLNTEKDKNLMLLNSEIPEGAQDEDKLQETAQSLDSSKMTNSWNSWIKLLGFDDSLKMNVFSLHAAGGIVCLMCTKHSDSRRIKNEVYTNVPAKPMHRYRL